MSSRKDDYKKIRGDRTCFNEYWHWLNVELESMGAAPVTQGPAHRAWARGASVAEAAAIYAAEQESKP